MRWAALATVCVCVCVCVLWAGPVQVRIDLGVGVLTCVNRVVDFEFAEATAAKVRTMPWAMELCTIAVAPPLRNRVCACMCLCVCARVPVVGPQVDHVRAPSKPTVTLPKATLCVWLAASLDPLPRSAKAASLRALWVGVWKVC